MFSQMDSILRNESTTLISSGINNNRKGDMPSTYITPLQPHTMLLKDGETIATMYPISAYPELLPMGLLAFLLDEFNMEIEKGDSFPFYETLTLEQFREVWFHSEGHVCIMVLGEIPELDYSIDNDLSDLENNYGTDIETLRHTLHYKKRKERRNINLNIQWEKQCLGIFSLQPAYPGRSSHVVTGQFLVNAGIRGKGIGKTLVESFVEWSKRLGFTSCCFPLIYSTNVGIRRILEVLNFRRIGKLPESGILKGFDVPVDSFIYGKEFTHITKSIDSLRDPQQSNDIAKYERLRYYLDSGRYPPHCDRNEKARLRVSSKTHSLLNGKLMTKGREIIYDLDNQRQIALEMHMVEHQGINKITSRIVERYHWKGIKNTVSEVIAQCIKCKMRHQDGTGVVVMPTEHVRQAHMLPEHHQDVVNDIDQNSTLSQMAAAVVRNLQNDTENEEAGPTPPDISEMKGQINKPLQKGLPIKTLKSNNYEGGTAIQSDLVNETTLNAFNKFVEEEHVRKRRRYLDVAEEALLNNSSHDTIIGINQSNKRGNTRTIALSTDSNDQIMNEAMLNLEGNVMAAVELAQHVRQKSVNNSTDSKIQSNPSKSFQKRIGGQ